MKLAKQRIARTSENVRMLNELETAEALSAMGRRFACAWEKGKRKFAAEGGYDTPDEVISECLASWSEYLKSGRVAPPDFMDSVTDLPDAVDIDIDDQ